MNPLLSQPNKWYDKPATLTLVFLFLFPIGAYGLYRTRLLTMGDKILISFGLAILLVFLLIFIPDNPSKKLTPAEIAWEARRNSIEKDRKLKADALIMVRRTVRTHIKNNLKDPDSFEEIDHGEFINESGDQKKRYTAFIKYRAKNSFGGFNVEKWCFEFSADGEATNLYECQ